MKIGTKFGGYATWRRGENGKIELSEICMSPEDVLKKFPLTAPENGIVKVRVRVDNWELEPAIKDGV